MATATRITEEQITEEPAGVRLELTQSEAQYLMDLVGTRVVGSGVRRIINTALFDALRSAGMFVSPDGWDRMRGSVVVQ